MGIKKHSLASAFGRGRLQEMVGDVHEDDGRRFGDSGRPSHRGLSPKSGQQDFYGGRDVHREIKYPC
ncbi:MAG: hypothetical protein KDJ26_05080 [Alphaproteobacteria bacterium]|nr:hypothetical protein [Alphaproteobacteria bacterium]MCB1551359.1 hypothetical protein [Alphaproteobacteria bacterium]MCB9984928.1 hypothetical protein [Micavibrio sp.]HPQ50476.1 hypothetical protein [Alphaproteobacteria bacterium]HRK97319.1 hypothetical protein [Alphaproteobacteria bacterium]